jgi:hypothetical protein
MGFTKDYAKILNNFLVYHEKKPASFTKPACKFTCEKLVYQLDSRIPTV